VKHDGKSEAARTALQSIMRDAGRARLGERRPQGMSILIGLGGPEGEGDEHDVTGLEELDEDEEV
jgi:hypothetical protein